MEQVIVELARKLGLEAARVWPQVVMVTWVTSLFWAVACPVLVVASGVAIWRIIAWAHSTITSNEAAFKAAKANASGYVSSFDYDSMNAYLVCIPVVLIAVMVALVALVSWPDNIAGALYPEAVTVLKLAKGVKP